MAEEKTYNFTGIPADTKSIGISFVGGEPVSVHPSPELAAPNDWASPGFETLKPYTKTTGWPDWRHFVPEGVRDAWNTFTPEQKRMLARWGQTILDEAPGPID